MSFILSMYLSFGLPFLLETSSFHCFSRKEENRAQFQLLSTRKGHTTYVAYLQSIDLVDRRDITQQVLTSNGQQLVVSHTTHFPTYGLDFGQDEWNFQLQRKYGVLNSRRQARMRAAKPLKQIEINTVTFRTFYAKKPPVTAVFVEVGRKIVKGWRCVLKFLSPYKHPREAQGTLNMYRKKNKMLYLQRSPVSTEMQKKRKPRETPDQGQEETLPPIHLYTKHPF